MDRKAIFADEYGIYYLPYHVIRSGRRYFPETFLPAYQKLLFALFVEPFYQGSPLELAVESLDELLVRLPRLGRGLTTALGALPGEGADTRLGKWLAATVLSLDRSTAQAGILKRLLNETSLPGRPGGHAMSARFVEGFLDLRRELARVSRG